MSYIRQLAEKFLKRYSNLLYDLECRSVVQLLAWLSLITERWPRYPTLCTRAKPTFIRESCQKLQKDIHRQLFFPWITAGFILWVQVEDSTKGNCKCKSADVERRQEQSIDTIIPVEYPCVFCSHQALELSCLQWYRLEEALWSCRLL